MESRSDTREGDKEGSGAGQLDCGPPVMYALFPNHTCVQWPRTVRTNAVDSVTGLQNVDFDTYDCQNVPGWTPGQPAPALSVFCNGGSW
jgi:hypothetical protein